MNPTINSLLLLVARYLLQLIAGVILGVTWLSPEFKAELTAWLGQGEVLAWVVLALGSLLSGLYAWWKAQQQKLTAMAMPGQSTPEEVKEVAKTQAPAVFSTSADQVPVLTPKQ
jgi:hypothetical protein